MSLPLSPTLTPRCSHQEQGRSPQEFPPKHRIRLCDDSAARGFRFRDRSAPFASPRASGMQDPGSLLLRAAWPKTAMQQQSQTVSLLVAQRSEVFLGPLSAEIQVAAPSWTNRTTPPPSRALASWRVLSQWGVLKRSKVISSWPNTSGRQLSVHPKNASARAGYRPDEMQTSLQLARLFYYVAHL
jgi:hypothetical protein